MSKTPLSNRPAGRPAPAVGPSTDAAAVPAPGAIPAPRFTVLQPPGGNVADGAWCGPDGCHVPATPPKDPQSPGKG